jgi:hypothetical protein
VKGHRFDAFTRTLGQNASSARGKVRLDFGGFVAALRTTLGFGAETARWAEFNAVKRGSEQELYYRRMRFIRERAAEDVEEHDINPREFLSKLTRQSREHFLSLLTPLQQTKFLRIRSSREFFNFLTPEQRTDAVLNFSPQFTGLEKATRPLPKAKPVSMFLDLPISATSSRIRKPVTRRPFAKRHLPPALNQIVRSCSLKQQGCYFTYQATPATDRDGSPCTYGPVPCGTNSIGRHTAFCATAAAATYGCDAVSTQVHGIAECQHSTTGTPLERLCNATNFDPKKGIVCDTGSTSPGPAPLKGNAHYTSVVTNDDWSACVIDSYKDPVSGVTIQVAVKTDINGHAPCIQQSEPGACGGVDCPCPGLYISQSAFRVHGISGPALMNPTNYVNPLSIPYISVPRPIADSCGLKTGMLAMVSATFNSETNPTEDSADWIVGVIGDVGATVLGEMSYAMRLALGMPGDHDKLTFRIYPQLQQNLPLDLPGLEMLKQKYLGVCCPGDIDDQCHAKEMRGVCVTDLADPNAHNCRCKDGWLPDLNGDCNWHCPGSDGSVWLGLDSTDSGYEECNGWGHCVYDESQNGVTEGRCVCDAGAWAGPFGSSCIFTDCIKLSDFGNAPNILPCYGHGTCEPADSINLPGSCVCDDGWGNGDDGLQYCSEKDCPKDCSGHGYCAHFIYPFCVCDVEHGWYGNDCSQQGCVTADGSICNSHGSCELGRDGATYCRCDDEWGGANETGPNACSQRQCPDCPPNVASCTHGWHWYEIFGLCIFGDHCQSKWTCQCNDDNLVPPQCTSHKCCSQFTWGECSKNMRALGAGGGGVCQPDGTCACYDGYDPAQCCAYPLNGVYVPPGFGGSCYGINAKTISVSCSGATATCGSCPAGSSTLSHTLVPLGNGKFKDELGNSYSVDESICKFTLTSLGATTIGAMCGLATSQPFWLRVSGDSGDGLSDLICPTDCTICSGTLPCTVTLH